MQKTNITGNKGEWSEIYVVLKLLADGKIYAADEYMEKVETLVFPILQILRQEANSNTEFVVSGMIKVVDALTKECLTEIDRSYFLRYANIILNNIKILQGRSLSSKNFTEKTKPIDKELISFLEQVKIQNIKAKSTDKADIVIQIHDLQTGTQPILGFSIKSMIGKEATLFNPGSGTNFIFEVDGIPLSESEVAKINLETYKANNNGKIGNRIRKIEELGGQLNYSYIQSKKFELNLQLIDGDLPKILAAMLKIRYLERKPKLRELIETLETQNPLGYTQSYNHQFYKYKILRLLYDMALGMTPETVWNGEIKANGGIIVVKDDGEVLAYHTYHKSKFEEYLLNNTSLEQASTGEDKNTPGIPNVYAKKKFYFGWLYNKDYEVKKEKIQYTTNDNGKVKIKINLQIRFNS